MQGEEKVFRYKLDFYYQSALIYLVTLVLYGGIRGSFVESRFEYVLNDPLMYVIVFFVVMSILALLLNRVRDRRLILTGKGIIFKNRFHEYRLETADIEWMHIGREARVRTSGVFQVVVLKLKNRRRLFRIRVGRYERAKELILEMQKLVATIPGRKRRRWQRPKITDR
jgi:uncharacterized membrane protein YobD (UPF0266 family)